MVQKLLLVTAAVITLSACDTPQSVCEEVAYDPQNRQMFLASDVERKEFIDACIKAVERYVEMRADK